MSLDFTKVDNRTSNRMNITGIRVDSPNCSQLSQDSVFENDHLTEVSIFLRNSVEGEEDYVEYNGSYDYGKEDYVEYNSYYDYVTTIACDEHDFTGDMICDYALFTSSSTVMNQFGFNNDLGVSRDDTNSIFKYCKDHGLSRKILLC